MKAPTGQKNLHHPLLNKKIKMIKAMKTIRANGKNSFGENLPGYRTERGMVPTKKPIGQISVNMNPRK